MSPLNESQMPTNADLSIINFSSYSLSEEEVSVLKKGLDFCPSRNLDKFEVYKDLHLFIRKLILKKLYHRQQGNIDHTPQEKKALDQLISLLEENNTADLIDSVDLP